MSTEQPLDKASKKHRFTEDELLQDFSKSAARVFVKLRKQKGYTSYESFAYEYDLPRAQYWRVETGRFNLTFRTLAKLLAIHKLILDEYMKLFIKEREAKHTPASTTQR
jgi:hypothetical protein